MVTTRKIYKICLGNFLDAYLGADPGPAGEQVRAGHILQLFPS